MLAEILVISAELRKHPYQIIADTMINYNKEPTTRNEQKRKGGSDTLQL